MSMMFTEVADGHEIQVGDIVEISNEGEITRVQITVKNKTFVVAAFNSQHSLKFPTTYSRDRFKPILPKTDLYAKGRSFRVLIRKQN